MAKIYSDCNPKPHNLKPKAETVSFILSYSKALSVIDCNEEKFELLLN